MATPSKADLMARNMATMRKKKDSKNLMNKCSHQFPDCPADRTKDSCKTCPYWRTK